MKLNSSALLSLPGKIWWLCWLVASTEMQKAQTIAKERKVGDDYITVQSIVCTKWEAQVPGEKHGWDYDQASLEKRGSITPPASLKV